MNNSRFSRNVILIGERGQMRLFGAHVYVFGVGGVGGAAAEALCRAGVGHLTLVDGDIVVESNLNRQAAARISTLGMNKALALKMLLADINPECKITAVEKFFNRDTCDGFDFSGANFVLDCIDNAECKVLLAVKCKEADTDFAASMGAGNSLHGEFAITDIYKTSGCALARKMRKLYKAAGIERLDVVYNKAACENVCGDGHENRDDAADANAAKQGKTVGSIGYVTASAGLALAGHAVRKILNFELHAGI